MKWILIFSLYDTTDTAIFPIIFNTEVECRNTITQFKQESKEQQGWVFESGNKYFCVRGK